MKISRVEARAKQGHVDALKELWERVPPALKTCRAEIRAALDKANKIIGDYNVAVTEAEEFRDRVKESLQDEFDEKSERWQEGDAGQAAQDLISEWETGLDTLELLDCVEPELSILPNDTPAFETLAGMSEESEG